MAGLATLPAGLRSPLTVISEIAGAVLSAYVSGARRLFAILGEVSGISRTTFFCYRFLSPPLSKHRGVAPDKNRTKGRGLGLLQICCESGGDFPHDGLT